MSVDTSGMGGGTGGDGDGGSRKRKLDASGLAGLALRKSTRTRKKRNTAPFLSAALAGAGTEAPCGGFTRIRNWTVHNPVRGLIIQRVTRTFNVERYDTGTSAWVPITGPALDTYVTDPASSVCGNDALYWEVWRVRTDGSVVGVSDRFALCSLIPVSTAASYANTTRGSYTMSGEAAFYPTTEVPTDLGFAEGAVAAAGDLLSRATDPAGDLTGAGVAASGGTVTFTVTSTWDSSWTGPPSTTDVPFIPPDAYSDVTET